MRIAELWRYPVKSMAGESLQVADVRETGIVGDRVVHVVNAVGRTVTSRTKPKLLGYRATLGADGEPLVDGKPWRELDVRDAAGLDARLVRDDGVERFDVLPLLVATDGAIAAFGYDGRVGPTLAMEGMGERNDAGRNCAQAGGEPQSRFARAVHITTLIPTRRGGGGDLKRLRTGAGGWGLWLAHQRRRETGKGWGGKKTKGKKEGPQPTTKQPRKRGNERGKITSI